MRRATVEPRAHRLLPLRGVGWVFARCRLPLHAGPDGGGKPPGFGGLATGLGVWLRVRGSGYGFGGLATVLGVWLRVRGSGYGFRGLATGSGV